MKKSAFDNKITKIKINEKTYSIELSIALKNTTENTLYKTKKIDFFKLYNIVTENYYSPIIFKEGKRKASNFIKSYMLVLDFDEGMELREAKKIFAEYKSIILTTRNHQKEKGGKTCDRFRVFLLLDEPIEDIDVYKTVMANIIAKYGADRACKDGARMFYNSPEGQEPIVSDGEYFPWRKFLKETDKRKNTQPTNVNKKDDGSHGFMLAEVRSFPTRKNEKIQLASETIIKTRDLGDLSVSAVLEKLSEVDKIICRCPSDEHEDKNPSAFAVRTENGSLRISCSGCNTPAYYDKNTITYDPNLTTKDIKKLAIKIVSKQKLQGCKNKEEARGKITLLFERVFSGVGAAFNDNRMYLYAQGVWSFFDEDGYKLTKFLSDFAKAVNLRRSINNADLIKKVVEDITISMLLDRDASTKPGVCVNLKNGTLVMDAKHGVQVEKHSKEDYFRYILDFGYNPKATCPKFQKFLDEVLPDKALQTVLIEYLAYVFMPRKELPLQYFMVLLGSGANGKSVIHAICTRLFGKANISNMSLNELNDKNQIAELDGKLLIYSPDLGRGKIDGEAIKRITSGEPMIARRLYGSPYEIDELPKIMGNLNQMPHVTENGFAIMRRALIIPFDVTIPPEKQNPHIADELLVELPGIFNMIVKAGLRLLQNKRFSDSEIIEKMRQQFNESSNPVLIFIKENYKKDPKGRVDGKDLYDEYQDWCNKNGHRNPLGRNSLTTKLKELGYNNRKSNGDIIFDGLKPISKTNQRFKKNKRLDLDDDFEDIYSRKKTLTSFD